MQRWWGVIWIIVSATSFGTLAIWARLAYAAGATPTTVLWLRFSLATTVMLVIVLVRRARMPRGRTLTGLIGMGAIGYVGQSLCYFMALTMASAGLVALLLYLYPVLVTLLAAVFLKERLTRLKVIALIIALVGSALTIGPIGQGRVLGIVLGVGGAVIYAIYIVVGSRITPHAGPLISSTIIMAAAATVYTGIVAVQGVHLPTTTLGWLAIVGVALVSTVVAIVTFFAGLERVGPSTAATLSTFEPAITVVLAAIVLQESITATQIAGGSLIMIAVVMLARQPVVQRLPESNAPSPTGNV